MTAKPTFKPTCPNFSSGPCAKRPGWTLDVLKGAYIGRSDTISYYAEPEYNGQPLLFDNCIL